MASLCDQTSFRELHLLDQVQKIRWNLGQPLRIAFAARVSAGKSTLTNALLGARIAPVGAGETTKLVCHFAASDVESVTLAFRTGDEREIYLSPDGQLPSTLPFPVEQLDHIDVRIPYSPILETTTLIDTPGISSVRPDASGRTTELLFSADSRRALAGADALVFLLHGHEDEASALASFQDLAGGSTACSVNAIGLISQPDKLGDAEDPMGAAWRIARRLSREERLRSRVACVIPVCSLIAQTVETGAFTVEDEAALAGLAGEDDDKLDDLLYSADDLLEADCAPSRSAREQLLAKLDMYGIRVAAQALREGAAPADLERVLRDASGVEHLKSLIHDVFIRRADLLKADQALSALERLTYQSGDAAGHQLRTRIEQLRLSPPMHAVREIWALSQHAQGQVEDLPEWLVDGLVRVTRGRSPRERLGLAPDADSETVKATAMQGVDRCRGYAGRAASGAHRGIAETLRRSYEFMLLEALQAVAADEQRPRISVEPAVS